MIRDDVIAIAEHVAKCWEQAVASGGVDEARKRTSEISGLGLSTDEVWKLRLGRRLSTNCLRTCSSAELRKELADCREIWKIDNTLRPVAVKLQSNLEKIHGEDARGIGVTMALFLAREGFVQAGEIEGLEDDTIQKAPRGCRANLHRCVRRANELGKEHRARKARERSVQVTAKIDGDDETRRKFIQETLPMAEKGPSRAMDNSRFIGLSKEELEAAREEVRRAFVVASAPNSKPAYRSALNSWSKFCRNILNYSEAAVPPKIEDLGLWATHFRSEGTFSNYLTGLKWACEYEGVETAVFGHPLIVRMKRALRKREVKKTLCGIQGVIVEKIVSRALAEGDVVAASLYVLAYAFLLRVPSELLPALVGTSGFKGGQVGPNTKTVVEVVEDKEVRITIRERKNCRTVTTMNRTCTCRSCVATCPVHAAKRLIELLGEGCLPYAGWYPQRVSKDLRRRLRDCGIENVEAFTLHSFRRGRAMDLAEQGGTLSTILEAGGWNSSAFTAYVNMSRLRDKEANKEMLNMVVMDSDSESDTD